MIISDCVIPAKAGIQGNIGILLHALDPRLREDDSVLFRIEVDNNSVGYK